MNPTFVLIHEALSSQSSVPGSLLQDAFDLQLVYVNTFVVMSANQSISIVVPVTSKINEFSLSVHIRFSSHGRVPSAH